MLIKRSPAFSKDFFTTRRPVRFDISSVSLHSDLFVLAARGLRRSCQPSAPINLRSSIMSDTIESTVMAEPEASSSSAILTGMKRGFPIFLGYVPLGFAYGVTRSSETELYASVLSDPALSAQISEGGAAHAAFTAFESALTDITSSQAVLTAAAEALTDALVPVSVIPGDADGDGVVTASDALLIARHAMQLQILTGNALEAADVDGNGTVALTDALLALRIAING